MRRLPAFTIASLGTPILIGVLSYPTWSYYLRDSDPTGKAGMFVVVALVILTILSVAAGSVVGLILAIIGHFRKERWRLFRGLSLILNTLVLAFGIYTLCSLPRRAPEAEQGGGGNSATLRASP